MYCRHLIRIRSYTNSSQVKAVCIKACIDSCILSLEQTVVSPNTAVNDYLAEKDSSPLKSGCSLKDLLRRPELNLADVLTIEALSKDKNASTEKLLAPVTFTFGSHSTTSLPDVVYKRFISGAEDLNPQTIIDICEEVEILVKYEGYIKRQLRQVEEFKRLESRALPRTLDYQSIPGLRIEAREKLEKIRPENFGQAGRISGVSPADLAALMIYMETKI